MNHQMINCNVASCKYNTEGAECSLDRILVSNDVRDAQEKRETECASFEK